MDVFVLASVWEGQPLALLQAMACGAPVLASNIEGTTAVLGKDHPGLFPPGDARWLAKLIVACSRDSGFLRQLMDSQKRTDLPWSDDAAAKLTNVYRSLIP